MASKNRIFNCLIRGQIKLELMFHSGLERELGGPETRQSR